MLIVPVDPVPAQTLSVILANQNVQLRLFQLETGLYMDLYMNNETTPFLAGVVCQNVNRLVRNAYFGFIGDFVFIDVLNLDADPVYSGLGTRFFLAYLEAADILGDAP